MNTQTRAINEAFAPYETNSQGQTLNYRATILNMGMKIIKQKEKKNKLKAENEKLKAEMVPLKRMKAEMSLHKCPGEGIGEYPYDYIKAENAKLKAEIVKLKAENELYQDPTKSEKRLLEQQRKGFQEEIVKLKAENDELTKTKDKLWCVFAERDEANDLCDNMLVQCEKAQAENAKLKEQLAISKCDDDSDSEDAFEEDEEEEDEEDFEKDKCEAKELIEQMIKNGHIGEEDNSMCDICADVKWVKRFTVVRDNGEIEHNCPACYKEGYNDDNLEECSTCHKLLEGRDPCSPGCPEYDEGWSETHNEIVNVDCGVCGCHHSEYDPCGTNSAD